VTNVPSPDTNDLSGLITTGPSASYTFGFSLQATPYASVLQRGQYIWLNVTGSNVVPTAASIVVNGQPSQPVPLYSQTGSTYSYRFTSPLFGIQVITAIWTIDPSGLTDTATYEYATALVPPYLGTYVSALYSNTATHSYQITLSGVPSGTGFYQQLITISNPSQYGINKAGSNIQFTASNGTLLYAWEQSINSSALQVWVKNFNGSSTIDMQVLPSFENLFSENGYIGFGTTYFNAKNVFPDATDFSSGVLPSWITYVSSAGSYSISNGILSVSSNTYHQVTLYANISLSSNGTYFGGLVNFTAQQEYFAFTNTNESVGELFEWWDQTNELLYYTSNKTGDTPELQSIPSVEPNIFNRYLLDFSTTAGTGTVNQYSYTAPNTTYYLPMYPSISGVGSLEAKYLFIAHAPQYMPTFTIGTGSVFQANATQTSKIFYNGVSNYAPNPLLQVYTYDIYDSFSSNYITILANPNWTFVSDSGYALPYDAASSELTFFNVSGAGQLQAQFLQPSQEIGQPSFVSLSGSLD
jgi:hypothetical protein